MKYKQIILLLAIALMWLPARGHAAWREPTPLAKTVQNYRLPLTTTVYARDNTILGYFYRQRRFYRPLAQIPPYLIKAFLAAEDNAFYSHDGVDVRSLFRALSKNIEAGGITQGGSTITQQLVKRLFLTPERSFARKIKEAYLAYRLEKHAGKDKILELYLNQIFLGAGSYGVEAAARTYFAKAVDELNLAECALLAGLPKAPSALNPYHAPSAAKRRQRYVLGRMRVAHWITKAQQEEALQTPLVFKRMKDPTWQRGPYYLDQVRRWLITNLNEQNLKRRGIPFKRYGADALYEGGLHIYTAYDPVHQQAAEGAVRRGLEALSRRRGYTGPLTRIAPERFDAFLKAQAQSLSGFQFSPGRWVKALVTSVKPNGADVRVGSQNGFVSVATMRWCRKPDPQQDPRNAPFIDDAHKVLSAGDVVWTMVKNVNDQGLVLALVQRPEVQGALLSMDPKNGDVLALVGGYDYDISQFNRATQAKRQPGSAFKPIVYSAALDSGYTAASILNDAPWSIIEPHSKKRWQPKNFSGKFSGPITLRTALVKSKNVVAARLANEIGMAKVVARAQAMGIGRRLPRWPAVSLGAYPVSLMDMCRVYSTFARGGSHIAPRFVIMVKDSAGKLLFEETPQATAAITPQNAYLINYLLKDAVKYGTGRPASRLWRPVAGKTGTTNQSRDAWFIGYTPYLLTGVYVGFDQGQPLGKKETGASAACPIWVDYRGQVEWRYPIEDFQTPSNIRFARMSADGYRRDAETAEPASMMPFVQGTAPPEISPDRDDGLSRADDPQWSDSEDLTDILLNSGYQKKVNEIFRRQKENREQ